MAEGEHGSYIAPGSGAYSLIDDLRANPRNGGSGELLQRAARLSRPAERLIQPITAEKYHQSRRCFAIAVAGGTVGPAGQANHFASMPASRAHVEFGLCIDREAGGHHQS